MNGIDFIFDSAVWQQHAIRLSLTLLHFVWQGLLVGAIAAVAFACSRRRSANTRYLIACTAFFSLAMLAAVTFFLIEIPVQVAIVSPDAIENAPLTVVEASLLPDTSDQPSQLVPSQTSIEVLPSDSVPAPMLDPEPDVESAAATFSHDWLKAVYPFLPLVAAAYLAGALLLLVRLQLRIWRGARLCSRSPIVHDQSLLNLTAKLARRAGLKCVPAIRYCDRIVVPTVVGILKPVVLVPASIISQLTPDELAAILKHELAHIRRLDPVVQVLQKTVEALLFFHPVTWWLSRRIRIERENCCDDIASRDSGQLTYAAALLRMAELCVGNDPKRSTALANLAVDGNNTNEFASRIRRLIGADDTPSFGLTRRGTYLLLAIGLLASVSFAASTNSQPITVEPSEVSAMDKDQPPFWGDVSHGLRCRIVPVSPSMDAEKIVMTKTADRFASPDDITFAIEIENVSDQPIKLKDVRHNDGKLDTNHFAPHMFEFLFTDPSGKPIARTQREFVLFSHALIFHSAMDTEIKSQQKIKYLLQPAKFHRSMEYHLPPGDYRVQVRYQGPSQAVKNWVIETQKSLPPETSWPHQVASNVVSFSIDAKLYRQPDLVWGPETDGLQAALEIGVPRDSGIPTTAPGILPETGRHAVLHVKNVSNKPITFVSETGRQGDTLQIRTAKGEEIEVKDTWFSGRPIDVAWTILPGEVAELDVLTPGLNQRLKPGEYLARYTIRFNSRVSKDDDGNQTFPAPGDYQSVIDTGWAPLFLRDPSEVGQAVSAIGDKVEAAADEGVLWSKKSRNGLLAGAKLLSATGKLKLGDPVVVQFVLKNGSDEEQIVVLQASDSHPVLGANNRLELNVLGKSQDTFQHTLKPGEILEKREYRVTVDTTGMSPGKYTITSGAAFWQTKQDKPNSATGIPYRREIPFTLGDLKLVKQKQPPVDENPETKIYWGKPSGNLILGMRLPKGRQTWPDGQTDIEGQLFLFNAGEDEIELTYELPKNLADWNMHVTSRDNDKAVRLDSTWYSGFRSQRGRTIRIPPGKQISVTGVRAEVTTGGKIAEEMIKGPTLRVLKEKTKFEYGDPKRLINQQGRFSFHAAITIRVAGLLDSVIIASSAPVPFEVKSDDGTKSSESPPKKTVPRKPVEGDESTKGPATSTAANSVKTSSSKIPLDQVVWWDAGDGLEAGFLLTSPAKPNDRVPANSIARYKILVRNKSEQEIEFLARLLPHEKRDAPFLISSDDINEALKADVFPDQFRATDGPSHTIEPAYVIKLAQGESAMIRNQRARNDLAIFVGDEKPKEDVAQAEINKPGMNWIVQPLQIHRSIPPKGTNVFGLAYQLTKIDKDGNTREELAVRRGAEPGGTIFYPRIQLEVGTLNANAVEDAKLATWGEVDKGLQCGIRLLDPKAAYEVGDTLEAELLWRNVSDQEIWTPIPGRLDFYPQIFDSTGQDQQIQFGARFDIYPVAQKISAGEVRSLGTFKIRIVPPDTKSPKSNTEPAHVSLKSGRYFLGGSGGVSGADTGAPTAGKVEFKVASPSDNESAQENGSVKRSSKNSDDLDQTTIQSPASKRVVAATVLGEPIYLDQFDQSASDLERLKKSGRTPLSRKAELLLARVAGQVMMDYYQREDLHPTKEEVSAKFVSALQDHPELAINMMLDKDARFEIGGAMAFGIASSIDWVVTKHLHEKYGGNVSVSSFGAMISIEGRNALIREYVDRGDVQFHLPELKQALWEQAEKKVALDATIRDQKHVKQKFETAPWENFAARLKKMPLKKTLTKGGAMSNRILTVCLFPFPKDPLWVICETKVSSLDDIEEMGADACEENTTIQTHAEDKKEVALQRARELMQARKLPLYLLTFSNTGQPDKMEEIEVPDVNDE